jgi:hypothetical protein
MKSFIKNISLFSIIVLSAMMFSTCKKYPEDDSISLMTVRTRMSGEWKFEKIEINNEDIKNQYNDSLAPLTIDDFWFWIQFRISDYGSGSRDFILINKQSKNKHDAKNTDVCGIDLQIYPKKNKQFSTGGGPWNYIPHNDKFSSKILLNIFGRFQTWDIKKLYNNKMILERNSNGVKYRLYLIQTRNK